MRHLTPLLSALLLTGGAIMAQTPNTPPLALPPPQVTGVAEPIIAQPPKTPPPGSEQAPVSADARIPEDVWLKMLRYMEQFAKEPRLQKPEPEGTSENPNLHDSIFRWGLLGSALDGVGGRMRTARRATRDVDLIRY